MSRTRVVPAHQIHWLALVVAAFTLFAHSIYIQPWTMDDAYIYMRYAENLALGKGIVYNPGERVEGYTTVIWVCLMAMGKLGGFGLVLFSKILGTIFALLCMALLACSHRFMPGVERPTAAAATLLLASCSVFTLWAMGGMDTTMVAFWVLFSLLTHCWAMQSPEDRRRSLLSGMLCGVAMIARPETILAFAPIGLDRFGGDLRRRDLSSIWLGAAFLFVYLPYFLWRYAYYGYLLPNTFYAKVGSTWAQMARGVEYVSEFGWLMLAVIVPALATLLFASSVSKRYPHAWVFPATFVLQALYVVLVGGDAMPAFRFFVASLPILCLSAALALWALCSSRLNIVLALALIVAFNGLHTMLNPKIHNRVQRALVGLRGEEAGEFLRDHMPPDTVIAVNAAGAIAYFSGFKTIDMLGLNDAHIAHREMSHMGEGIAGHEKGDGKYVLAAKPDYIQFGPSLGQKRPMFRGDREIARSPQFKRSYVFKTYDLPSGNQLQLYERKGSPGARMR